MYTTVTGFVLAGAGLLASAGTCGPVRVAKVATKARSTLLFAAWEIKAYESLQWCDPTDE